MTKKSMSLGRLSKLFRKHSQNSLHPQWSKTKDDNDNESCSGNTHTTQDEEELRIVSFSSSVIVHETLSLEEYTPNELSNCFYNQEEYATIKKMKYNDIEIINEFGTNKKYNKDKYCERGLEKYINLDAIGCANDKDFSIQLVLEHQRWLQDEKNKNKNVIDVDGGDVVDGMDSPTNDDGIDEMEQVMVQMYSKACKKCKSHALRIGIQDYQDIKPYYMES